MSEGYGNSAVDDLDETCKSYKGKNDSSSMTHSL